MQRKTEIRYIKSLRRLESDRHIGKVLINMKEFDIKQDTLKVLEVPQESTDLEKEQYYLETLNNDECRANKK